MPWWSGFLWIAIVFINNGVSQSQRQPSGQMWPAHNENRQNPYTQPSNSNIDIQFDNEPIELISAGSGHGGFPSDDEDFGLSGSGSGSGYGDMEDEVSVTTTTTTTTTSTTPPTKRPLSKCERDKQHNQMVNKKMPDCLRNGDYAPLQCMDLPGIADCWCVDVNNVEIHGTRMEAPNIPSCDDGDNLSPCLFELVKAYRPQRFGAFIPKCTVDGQYDKQQCHGSICYCVDEETGVKIKGSEVSRNARPVCEDEEVAQPDDKDKTDLNQGQVNSEDEEEAVDLFPLDKEPPVNVGNEGVFPDPDPDVNIDDGTDDDDVEEDEEKDDEDGSNQTGQGSQPEIQKQDTEGYRSSVETAGEIMTQPGILAGIIGGSVVLLLCLVLLIMFIIYRMRKKDEGSYPLDEPRRPANYAYVRTPDKEFYA